MFSVNKQHQLILAGTVFITVVAGILIFIYPPALYPDPSWGFQVMRSMELGGGFNLAISPSQQNIAENTSSFLTWWSPGQYLLPYIFKLITQVNTGHASALTVLLCDLLGIFGFYKLFRRLGFTQRVSALSVAFIACQQYYYIPYVFYNGGETLLFGFLGWFLYGCFSFKQISWQMLVFILLTGWIGFFCKSAFLWMYASGMFCLWVNISREKKDVISWLKNGAVLAIPAALSLVAIFKFFVFKGVSPVSASAGFKASLQAVAFPLASPLVSGFSIDEIAHGIIFHQDKPILSPAQSIIILVILAILSIGLLRLIIGKIKQMEYKLVVSVFYAVSTIFFASAFLRQLDISLEARHFRIVGLLFVPGVIYFVTLIKPVYKIAFSLLWLGIAFSSFRYFKANYKYNATMAAHGPAGVSQLFIEQPALNYLHTLDEQHQGNAIFAFVSADLGLEIQHNRIITLDGVDGSDITAYHNDNTYYKHAGPLYIMLPAYYVTNGNAAIVQKCFPDYRYFSMKKVSKNYVVVSAN